MCLILFAFQQHPDYPLIVIANRDEYYARATRDAHWWDDADIFAGRDLEAGGTWLGINRSGLFAAVTNVRDPGNQVSAAKSRGELTRNYLSASMTAQSYLQALAPDDQQYAGFNLLIGSSRSLWFHSNRGPVSQAVKPGVYGISNGSFDEPWPKLSSGKSELATLLTQPLEESRLMEILTDNAVAGDHELPETGVPLDIERLLSSRFIRSKDYGTRACTLVMFDHNNRIHFSEHNFVNANQPGNKLRETITIQTAE